MRRFVEVDGVVELLPVWDGEEALPPLGTIEKAVGAMQPDTWFFIQQFRYRSTRGA